MSPLSLVRLELGKEKTKKTDSKPPCDDRSKAFLNFHPYKILALFLR